MMGYDEISPCERIVVGGDVVNGSTVDNNNRWVGIEACGRTDVYYIGNYMEWNAWGARRLSTGSMRTKRYLVCMTSTVFHENKEINYVLMGICHPDVVAEFKLNQTLLYGNVLSIYDSVDSFAGSCQDLFSFSAGKGIARHDEIVLHIGAGHGIL